MPSVSWRALGPGSVLGALRSELRKAEEEVVIVGPFIDDYFASAVVNACSPRVRLRILARPVSSVDASFAEHAESALCRFAARAATEVRTLARLHAKVAIVDGSHVFCGSANWYRYSLDAGLEIVLRGLVSEAPTLLDEVESLWEQGVGWSKDPRSTRTNPQAEARDTTKREGYRAEVLDSVAAEKLASVPGAFVLGRRGTKKGKRTP